MLRTRDPQWLVLGTPERLPFIWQRLRHAGRLWKLMVLTGLAAIGAMHRVDVRRSRRPRRQTATVHEVITRRMSSTLRSGVNPPRIR